MARTGTLVGAAAAATACPASWMATSRWEASQARRWSRAAGRTVISTSSVEVSRAGIMRAVVPVSSLFMRFTLRHDAVKRNGGHGANHRVARAASFAHLK